MNQIVTKILKPDDAGLEQAANTLRNGALVAFPTETVYGLGADARNDTAVAAIFEAKGRPSFNPLIIHVKDLQSAERIAVFSPEALRLASAFWPGPMTLVLPVVDSAGISPLVTAGLTTIAIRIPEHPLAQKLLNVFDGPIAAPSANPSGKVSPTSPQHVIDGLNGRIAAILDGGNCEVGLESTIIGLQPRPTLMRPGGLPVEIIETCLGITLTGRSETDTINAPGQLSSHYATRASIRLNAAKPVGNEVFLGFGPMECDLNLSRSGDLIEAAANLFRFLHQLDEKDAANIAIAPIPDHGLGRAINDRLTRAAAPRP